MENASISPIDIRVLLADDERLSRLVVGNLLRRCGYQVTVVDGGHEAIRLLQERADNYNLIIADLMMPGIDGLQLLRYVRSNPVLDSIPVVMMSSNDHQSTVVECVRAGAEEYLLKPVTKKEVTHIWQHVWRRQQNCSRASEGRAQYEAQLLAAGVTDWGADPSLGGEPFLGAFSDARVKAGLGAPFRPPEAGVAGRLPATAAGAGARAAASSGGYSCGTPSLVSVGLMQQGAPSGSSQGEQPGPYTPANGSGREKLTMMMPGPQPRPRPGANANLDELHAQELAKSAAWALRSQLAGGAEAQFSGGGVLRSGGSGTAPPLSGSEAAAAGGGAGDLPPSEVPSSAPTVSVGYPSIARTQSTEGGTAQTHSSGRRGKVYSETTSSTEIAPTISGDTVHAHARDRGGHLMGPPPAVPPHLHHRAGSALGSGDSQGMAAVMGGGGGGVAMLMRAPSSVASRRSSYSAAGFAGAAASLAGGAARGSGCYSGGGGGGQW
eukprot:jgi/Mesen1/10808/ME000093S10326